MTNESLADFTGKFVMVAGEHVASQIESDPDPHRIDHVWVTVNAGDFGPIRVSLNTCSLKNRKAGIDSRMFVAIVPGRWNILPATGIRAAAPLSYTDLGAASHLDYIPHDRAIMETLLLAKARQSVVIEAWGELYSRGHVGLHQVHSRHASAVVKTEHIGRDGAICFYFADARSETLLFKFSGQM